MTSTLKRTPLFAAHKNLGARLVPFGGWEMPVQYAGIMEEHHAVRSAAGIFDISHMGEVLVQGSGALDFLNQLLTNDVSRLSVGQGQYTLLCNDAGGVIDDLYLYRTEDQAFLMVINASRIEADTAWIQQQHSRFPRASEVAITDACSQMAAVAVQGPHVAHFIDRAFPAASLGGTPVPAPTALRKNQLARFAFANAPVWVARTGYTGEDGFEIITPAPLVESLWTILLEDGRPHGLVPCGLGARDTLRTEMGYPLYGHELTETSSPLEAGLGSFVALEKGAFLGRDPLLHQKTNGIVRRGIAFRMAERSAPPRPEYPIWSTTDATGAVGVVTSGTQSPSLNTGIGLGYVPTALAKPGNPILVEIRGRKHAAEIVTKPLYKKQV